MRVRTVAVAMASANKWAVGTSACVEPAGRACRAARPSRWSATTASTTTTVQTFIITLFLLLTFSITTTTKQMVSSTAWTRSAACSRAASSRWRARARPSPRIACCASSRRVCRRASSTRYAFWSRRRACSRSRSRRRSRTPRRACCAVKCSLWATRAARTRSHSSASRCTCPPCPRSATQ